MTTKRVRLNENVHEQLLYLKKQTNAKSINDVINALINIAEEQYLNNGKITTNNKNITLAYNKGVLVEIQIVK